MISQEQVFKKLLEEQVNLIHDKEEIYLKKKKNERELRMRCEHFIDEKCHAQDNVLNCLIFGKGCKKYNPFPSLN